MHAPSFASYQRNEPEVVVDAAPPGEGHGSELSRCVSRSVLLPNGRPGAWLVLLVFVCAFVIVEAVHLRLA